MPNTDILQLLTIVLPSLTAIAAIISPLITERLRAKSQLELKRLEILYDKKIEVYKEFTSAYGYMYESIDYDTYWKFASAANSVMIICDPDSADAISKLLMDIKMNQLHISNNINDQFELCVRLLRDSTNEKSKEHKRKHS